MQPMPPEELWQLVEASAQDTPLSPQDKIDLEYAMKLLTRSKPECHEYLWKHFVFGLAYGEIAEEKKLSYDNVRMKIGRCLEEVPSLVCLTMPKPKPNPEAALEKLGQRLRAGMAKKHPAQNLDAVREAVREQYEQEQTAQRSQPARDAAKDREPPEPEPER